MRVLVVDDHEASAKTMGWTIEIMGHDVRTAGNAEAAIAEAKSYRPHVVLMDISLPGMSGYDLCRAMQTDPEMKNTLFIAQTGWNEAEHRRLSREAGFSHHLVKPVDMIRLEQLLVTHSATVDEPGAN